MDEPKITAEFIIKEVSWYFGTCEKAVTSKMQLIPVTEIRQLCIYFCHKYSSLNHAGIAMLFNRDRPSVYYSIKLVQDFIFIEPDYAKKVKMAENFLIKRYYEQVINIDDEIASGELFANRLKRIHS